LILMSLLPKIKLTSTTLKRELTSTTNLWILRTIKQSNYPPSITIEPIIITIREKLFRKLDSRKSKTKRKKNHL